MELMTLVSNPDASMTSQEIADLVGVRHDNVKRTIERLAEKGVISHPQIEDGVVSANGVVPKHYRFAGEQGKRDSIVIVAQLSPEFTAKLVDRWQELEGERRPMTRLEWAKLQVQLLEDLERKEQEAEALRVTLDADLRWASVKRMEAMYKRRFQWQLLLDWCNQNRVEVRKVFDQNYGTVNSYPEAAWRAVYAVKVYSDQMSLESANRL